jgi:3-hydroxyacyl-[acyl-carrier-protein] dehydratase
MVPPLLFDISKIDLDQVTYPADEIEKINPHRGSMRMLDGIIYADEKFTQTVAYKDIRDDEFWVAGHIPGRPLFPGVLMIEAAAQLASLMMIYNIGAEAGKSFVGFVGAEKIKFRGQVVPGQRLMLLSKLLGIRRTQCTCASQGLVNGSIVFEAVVTGMLI